ncbi:putative Ras-related protein Rab-10 [Hypsibius exemplaris]|uniref:Ras-related protein Rab-10 n=1 Tax=Hypsibius exemplaris TaxID=2072580 RepID=A0A1W0XBV3_HYPEX|nr:putative Ras-related protein Rab-10 [Hypsibius exemplaris]
MVLLEGIDYKIKNLDVGGTRVKLVIWDSAGQESGHTVTVSYYRGVNAILLIYDITNKQSFRNIAEWLKNVREHTEADIEIMLIGNNAHMEGERSVSRERGECFARDHGISFLEVSAAMNFNVERAFSDVTKRLLHRALVIAPENEAHQQQTPTQPDRPTKPYVRFVNNIWRRVQPIKLAPTNTLLRGDSQSGIINADKEQPKQAFSYSDHESTRCHSHADVCHFEYVSNLGTGAYGTVFGITISHNEKPNNVISQRGNSKLVLKVLHLTTLPRVKQNILTSLSHLNVVRYIAFGHVSLGPGNMILPRAQEAVLMEFYGGGTLNSLARGSMLTEDTILNYMQQVTSGLKYLHARYDSAIAILKLPLFHGDLKGDNIFLTDDQRTCKIGDMENFHLLESGQTQSGGLLANQGTLCHMAPEMLRYAFGGEDVQLYGPTGISRASDIWSVGCVALELFGRGEVHYVTAHGSDLSLDMSAGIASYFSADTIMASFTMPNERAIRLQKMVKLADQLDQLQRDFYADFGARDRDERVDQGHEEFCKAQRSVWRKAVRDDSWWAVNGFNTSIKELPQDMFWDIFLHLEPFEQARLYTFWSATLRMPLVQNRVYVVLDMQKDPYSTALRKDRISSSMEYLVLESRCHSTGSLVPECGPYIGNAMLELFSSSVQWTALREITFVRANCVSELPKLLYSMFPALDSITFLHCQAAVTWAQELVSYDVCIPSTLTVNWTGLRPKTKVIVLAIQEARRREEEYEEGKYEYYNEMCSNCGVPGCGSHCPEYVYHGGHDLDGKVRSKSKTHALSDKMVEQRVQKGPRLLKRLQGKRLENVVSIDEAWCYMSYVNGRRKIYYQFRGRQSPRSFLKYWREKHPKGVMFVAGISYKGTTDIRFVPPRAKVNSDFYINKVLHPLFKKDIPRLFGKQAKMAVLHHDSAPAHKSAKTVTWLKSNGYKFIPEEDWPANSPDLSPMDYSINGIFKQRLWRRKTKSLEGLKRAMREEWKKIDIGLCRRTMKGWAPRVEKMLENKGYQFQHLRNLQKNVF